MSLLHSYSFSKEVDIRAYLIFYFSAKGGDSMDCSLEVIDAAMKGMIDLDKVEEAAMSDEGDTDKAFNLFAYNCAVHKNRKRTARANAGRMLCIMEDMAEDEPYGVSESVVSEYTGQVDEYGKLDDEYEFQYAVSTVNDRLVEILIYHRLHFWRCMQQALKGIPESVASLRRMAEEDPDIGELIWIILSSGKDIGRMIETEEVKGV